MNLLQLPSDQGSRRLSHDAAALPPHPGQPNGARDIPSIAILNDGVDEEILRNVNFKRRSSSVPNIMKASMMIQEESLAAEAETLQRQSIVKLWKQLRFDNYRHKERFYSIISILYAILIMVLGVCLPIAELFGKNAEKLYIGSFEGFYVYLFIISILFLVFVHVTIVRNHDIPACLAASWSRSTGLCSQSKRRPSHRSSSRKAEWGTASRLIRKRSISNRNMTLSSHAHSASFYLRLGAVAFGIGNMIHEGLYLGAFIEKGFQFECLKLTTVFRPVLQLCFTFWQLYFIFRNSKIVIHSYRLVCRLGLMHLVATNLCVWFRVVTIETIHELHSYLHDSDHHGDGHHGDGNHDNSHHDNSHHNDHHGDTHGDHHGDYYHHYSNVSSDTINETYSKLLDNLTTAATTTIGHGDDAALCTDPLSSSEAGLITAAINGVSPYLYACTVEFSLIMAGVMYMTWSNVSKKLHTPSGSDHELHSHSDHHTEHHKASHHHKASSDLEASPDKLKRVSVDCSGSNRGLFLGIFFLMVTVISLVLFFALSHGKTEEAKMSALKLMYGTQLALYVSTIIGVCGAAYQFRVLKFSSTGPGSHLDEVLLLIALIGNYVFCIFSAISNSHKLDVTIGIVAMVTSVCIMVQSTIQTLFILNGLRRSAYTQSQVEKKPGKQFVTFLLVVNSAMWAVNSFELLKAESSPLELQFYGHLPWSLITHISMPLAIFYRYHSTVCLADIWKDAYKIKSHDGHH